MVGSTLLEPLICEAGSISSGRLITSLSLLPVSESSSSAVGHSSGVVYCNWLNGCSGHIPAQGCISFSVSTVIIVWFPCWRSCNIVHMHCNDSYDWFYLHAHKLGSDDWSYMSPGKGGMPMMRGEQVSWVLSAGTLEGGCYISYSENAVPIEIEWFHVYSITRLR